MMNRRKFFKSLAIGVTTIVVAPKLLASKTKLDGYTIPKPMIHGIRVGNATWRSYTMPNGTVFTLVFDERYDNARQYLVNHDKFK